MFLMCKALLKCHIFLSDGVLQMKYLWFREDLSDVSSQTATASSISSPTFFEWMWSGGESWQPTQWHKFQFRNESSYWLKFNMQRWCKQIKWKWNLSCGLDQSWNKILSALCLRTRQDQVNMQDRGRFQILQDWPYMSQTCCINKLSSKQFQEAPHECTHFCNESIKI